MEILKLSVIEVSSYLLVSSAVLFFIIKWYNSKVILNWKMFWSKSNLKQFGPVYSDMKRNHDLWHTIQSIGIGVYALILSIIWWYYFRWSCIPMFVCILAIYWIWDVWLNLLIGEKILYRSETKVFDNIGGRFNWLVRGLVLIISYLVMVIVARNM